MKIVVQRQITDAISTTGEMLIDGSHFCWTLEPATPIPSGTYDLTIRQSPRFNRLMPHVENVPGHAGILIHWGNYAENTSGCTLVGTTQGEDFVGHSVDEFNRLFVRLQNGITDGPVTISYLDPTGGSGASGIDGD